MDLTADSRIPETNSQCEIYDLGDCIFNANCNEIKSKISPEYIHLEKKVADVLKCLAAANGEVVTREYIFENVWPNVIVSDDSLNRCISVLRKKLREFNHEVEIKTHPKIGFHLAYSHTDKLNIETPSGSHADIHTEVHTEPIVNNLELKQRIGADRRKQNASADRRKAYINFNRKGLLVLFSVIFVIGIIGHQYNENSARSQSKASQLLPTELLTSQLSPNRIVILPIAISEQLTSKYVNFDQNFRLLVANNPQMTTIAKTELLQSVNDSSLNIAQEFSARFIFRGQLSQQNNRDILYWTLVDGKTGDILLDTQINLAINSEQSNIREIIAEIIMPISNILFSDDKAARIDYIVKAADYLYVNPQSETLHRPIISMLASAISNIDEDSTTAMKKLSKILIDEMWDTRNLPAPFLDLAKKNIEQSILLTPLDGELCLLLARLHITKYQWLSARETLDDAIEKFSQAPNSNDFHLYELMLHAGYVSDEITLHFRQASQQDPLSTPKAKEYVRVLLRQGKTNEAISRADELGLESALWLDDGVLLGPALVRMGNLEDGKKMIVEGYRELGINQSYVDVLYQGLVYPSFAPQASAFLTQAANNKAFDRFLLLDIYAQIGDTERYFELALELASFGQFNPLTLMGEHALHIRKSPKFEVLVKKIGLVRYWDTYGFPNYCSKEGVLAC